MSNEKEKKAVYSSASMEAKTLILECVADEKEHERKELIEYVTAHAQKKEAMTSGVLAGAFKMLMASGQLVSYNRGLYQKGTGILEVDFQGKVFLTFEKFTKELDKICTVNMLQASEKDMTFIRKIAEINGVLHEKIEELKGEEIA